MTLQEIAKNAIEKCAPSKSGFDAACAQVVNEILKKPYAKYLKPINSPFMFILTYSDVWIDGTPEEVITQADEEINAARGEMIHTIE